MIASMIISKVRPYHLLNLVILIPGYPGRVEMISVKVAHILLTLMSFKIMSQMKSN